MSNYLQRFFVARVFVRRGFRAFALLVACAGSLFATQARAIDVASQTDWNTAVAAVAAAGAGSTVTINFTGGFTLTSSLATLQAGAANVTVNITGNNQTINGAFAFQGIQVSGANAPTVNISSLALTNTAALGGTGQIGQNGFYSSGLSYGSGGGGGGGLGAGGGLLVGSGAHVTLAAVTFTGNTATGGTGGNGGNAQNGAADPVNGGNGGAGGTLNSGAAVGGGGTGGTGGHTGTQGTAGSTGTNLGDGGGGGGGSGTTSRIGFTANNPGGAGKAGGGDGQSGGGGVTNDAGVLGPAADGGSGGNGGGGQGGAIYVAAGGTLTILDTPITGAAVTGGTGGAGGVGHGPVSENGTPGGTGATQGAGIFLSGVQANINVSTGTLTYGNTIGGTGLVSGGTSTAIDKTGAGTLVLSATNTFTGNVDISAGTLSVASQADLGSGSKSVVMSNGTTFAVTSNATLAPTAAFQIAGLSSFDIAAGTTSTLQGAISDGISSGTLVKTDTGTLVLSGANTFTGGTTVNGGTLQVGAANALPATGTVNVASGAILNLNGFNQTFGGLTGAGTVMGASSTIASGATFMPGNGTPGSLMALTGNLAFQSGSFFLVQVSPTASSSAVVTGTASLAGTVQASFAAGAYVSKKYTILTTTGGLGGTTFSVLANAGLPAGTTDTLSYDTNNVYLNLTPGFSGFAGLNINQQNVANTLTNYFNTTGGLPASFFGLSAGQLTQVDGEDATGAAKSTFQLMNDFFNLMLDPSSGNGGGNGANGGATGFAPEQDTTLPPEIVAAYGAMLTKEKPQTFDQRWTAWGSAFGAANRTNGDPVVGSNNVTASDYGFAAGMEYHQSPDTAFGFALAGGGTNWNLAQGLGSGRSEAFQAGVYAKTHFGPAYVSTALAVANNWFTTNRTAALGDQLQAKFQGQSYGARLEAGYRYGLPATDYLMGFTPYAAVQAQNFYTPAFSETGLAAGAFGLSYAAMNATDARSELGLRTDDLIMLGTMPLMLRGRLAWAHDWISNPGLAAAFQVLPGTSFVVNGAAPPRNSALTTLGAELHMTQSWSLLGKFDGQFSAGSQTYGGTGTLRYTW
jgi:autotransporter-associated beta strand protein